jgi:hypothetical protein
VRRSETVVSTPITSSELNEVLVDDPVGTYWATTSPVYNGTIAMLGDENTVTSREVYVDARQKESLFKIKVFNELQDGDCIWDLIFLYMHKNEQFESYITHVNKKNEETANKFNFILKHEVVETEELKIAIRYAFDNNIPLVALLKVLHSAPKEVIDAIQLTKQEKLHEYKSLVSTVKRRRQ